MKEKYFACYKSAKENEGYRYIIMASATSQICTLAANEKNIFLNFDLIFYVEPNNWN